MSPLHQEALRLARLDIPVFPCEPLTKSPKRGTRGFHDATTDPAVINAWWSENPDYNIASQPQLRGLAVVDRDGPEGALNWFNKELEHGAVETMTVNTPHGRHLYYKGDLPPSVGKLAPHVDTRGGGSYALLPPSRLPDGEYMYANDLPPADLPEWIPAHLAALAREHMGASSADLDQPANVARAKVHLKAAVERGDVAVEGQMGDARTFAMACELLNRKRWPEPT